MEQEQFILWSNDVPMPWQIYYSEHEARRVAEFHARQNRGKQIGVAKIVGTVGEPLPDLKWSDGAPAGDGHYVGRGLDECNDAKRVSTPMPRPY